MRPTPQQHPFRDDSGRIISLGDVRRRKAGRQRAPDRQYLVAVLLISALGWAAWATVLFTVPPARLLTYIAFFAPLFIALTGSSALAAYLVEWRLGRVSRLTVCLRRGALAALLVVVNLAAGAAHSWSFLVGGVSIAVVVVFEFALTRRAR